MDESSLQNAKSAKCPRTVGDYCTLGVFLLEMTLILSRQYSEVCWLAPFFTAFICQLTPGAPPCFHLLLGGQR